MQPVITIFCAFTRRWAIDGWLENLAAVEHDPALTNLCFIIDGDEPYIHNMLKKFAKEKGYRSFHVKNNYEWHANETQLKIRRQRVADIKNQSKELIALTDGEIVIGLEDDTVFDRLESFASLYQPLLDSPSIGFVEGVQMGRWGANIIGAWSADNSQPTKITTILPPVLTTDEDPIGKFSWMGLSEISGGGFYGYATRRQLYLDHDYYWATSQPWGPDVNYGLWLRENGYMCLINWGLIFGHNDHGHTAYPDKLNQNDPSQRLVAVVYNKDSATGKWNRTDHEQTRY